MSPGKDPSIDLSFGEFRIDRADERLWGRDGPVRLGNKAFQVLLMLARQEGRLLTKDALFASVWDGTIVSESALTSVVKELRRALGDDPRAPRYIESVYGRGYRLLPPVTLGPAPVPPPRRAAEPSSDERRLGEPPLLYIPAFDDSAVHGAQPHLAAVLREEMLFALSRFRDVRIVSDAQSRTAPDGVARFGERDYQLGVRLFHDGLSIKAFARISRLSDHAIVWADNIELTAGNTGQDVERMVRRIVAAALPSLQDDVLRNLPAEPDDLYDLHFHNQLRMRGQETLAEAMELAASWERLIERDPTFAPAYPPLIRLYNTDYRYTGLGSTGPAERARARDLAGKALAIDLNDSHVHTVAGWCHLWAYETAAAREHLEEAAALNPFHQERLLQAATGLMFADELGRAADLLERCRTLMPIATEGRHEDEGLLHLLRGEFEMARQRLALVTNETISSELYGLLAATACGAGDTALRSRAWQDVIARRWAGPEPLDAATIIRWALYHHPFQDSARRDWFAGLLGAALAAAPDELRPSTQPVAEIRC